MVGLEASGAVVMRRKVRRETLIALAEKLPPCVVGMEACCGAHHLGLRVCRAGAWSVLDVAGVCAPLREGAEERRVETREAIAEAATRPTMRFVVVKSQAQSDIQALHRARERLVSERTALMNHLRALLLERGLWRRKVGAN